MYRVDIYPEFAAVKVCKAATEHIHGQAFIGPFTITRRKNVIVDAAGKGRSLHRDVFRGKVYAQVSLQAVYAQVSLQAVFRL